MQAGKLAVTVHSASGFRASAAATESPLGPQSQVYCVCEVPGYGRLATEPSSPGPAPDDPAEWEQELTFEVGPSAEAKSLRAALYACAGRDDAPEDDFIGAGSLSLAHLSELGSQRHVRVPIVSAAGAHVADCSLDLRWFHGRSPGLQRDATGRAVVDAELAGMQPGQAERLLNARSPRSPTGSPRPSSPRIKPPPRDPPVPELAATLRSTLAGEP